MNKSYGGVRKDSIFGENVMGRRWVEMKIWRIEMKRRGGEESLRRRKKIMGRGFCIIMIKVVIKIFIYCRNFKRKLVFCFMLVINKSIYFFIFWFYFMELFVIFEFIIFVCLWFFIFSKGENFFYNFGGRWRYRGVRNRFKGLRI